jgi:alanine racemase
MNRWLEIDTNALKNNLKRIKKQIDWPRVGLMAVIKSNAYGHGLIETAKIFEKEQVDYLAVATFDEAIKLRKNNIKLPILIIGYTDKSEIKDAISNNISISLYDLDEAVEIINIAKRINKTVHVHIKLDTGMHRLGILADNFIEIYKKLINDKNIKIDYLYSHFADIKNKKYSDYQLKILNDIIANLKKEKLPVPKIHISRSESLSSSDTYYSMVRPGLALYGLCKSVPGLQPALTFKTKIAQIKKISKGDCVGYGLTFKAKKDMKIAIIAVGYADGYGRSLSNCGEVIARGIKCPVIGRVCMNLTIIDVSKVNPPAGGGDDVILIGKSGDVEVSASDLAQKTGTINYEIVARIPESIPRIYK